MALYTFTYTIDSGATQTFRCAASSHEDAARYWAEEQAIVRSVTGGPVTPKSVTVGA
jgi:hypothetical protein